MTEAMLAAHPATRKPGLIGSDIFLPGLLSGAAQPRRQACLGSDWLAEPMEDTEEANWYLHGFRTGRADEQHPSPPLWQTRNRRAWNRGRREGVRYS